MTPEENKRLLRRFYEEIDKGNAVAIHRIADGKIAEHWSGRDDLAVMQQLGVLSPPAPS